MRAKNGIKLEAGMEQQIFVFSPFVPCVSAFHLPTFPVTLPNNWHCNIVNIYNAYILKQRSIGVTWEMHLFPAKVGAKYAAGPTEPPRMPNFQQMPMI